MPAVHAAIAQLTPTVLDGPAAIEKTCQFITRAGEEEIQLLAFPETFIPGYPFWADAGTFGDGNELPMEAMVRAVGPLNGPGQCNAGFVRNEALLLVVFVTDEDDNGKSGGNPATWKQALPAARRP